MKIIALAIFITIFSITILADQTNQWEGIYTFEEESWNENRVREFRWFRLEVTKKDAKTLVATYSDGENSKTWRKFSLTVVSTKDKAIFYVDRDLSAIDIPCSEESQFHQGFLLFELRETKQNGKSVLQTVWGKENLGSQSETGGWREDNIFFRKVSRLR